LIDRARCRILCSVEVRTPLSRSMMEFGKLEAPVSFSTLMDKRERGFF